MTSVSPLNIALSGLKVAQAQIGVTSNNIANVSTPGYSRKSIEQYSNVLGGNGSGVATGTIQRRVDEILLKDYRTQISLTSGMSTTKSYLDQIQQFHGAPDAEQSISSGIGKLQDAFSQLANEPENAFQLNNVFNTAQALVNKLHDFSKQITQMRNNAQAEMTQSISSINALTKQIAELNTAIKTASSLNRSTADIEDQRDNAVKNLANELDLSYYKDQNNVLVVMTKNGQLLADTESVPVSFNSASLGTQSYYPLSAASVRLGNPTTGVDLTAEATLGGRLGALVTLRDKTLPVYQAQMDEVAHKMAMRFDAEGLKLFTKADGSIPPNNPTSYVGFAADIVINPAVITDQTLIRKGTNPTSTVQDGSSEVLRKIVQFAFGSVQYQQAEGTANISAPASTLYATLGISGTARIQGTKNLLTLGSLDSSPFINPGTEDTFSIKVGATGVPQNITITAGMTAGDLRDTINAAIPGLATLGTGGELVLRAGDDITIATGTLSASGLAELGFNPGTTTAVPPSFQIGVGNNTLTKITIDPTDTAATLLSKLNSVPGLEATITMPDGHLRMTPKEGGDLTLVDGLNSPLAALGVTVSNIAHVPFNVTGLGPSASLNGGVQGGTTIHDYATQAISIQSQDAGNNALSLTTEDSYRAALEKQSLDSSGVNLDEEMALLITIQTAYNASARTIRVVQDMMDELMATFSR